MKKRLICLGLAVSFALSNMSAMAFADAEWQQGWTGKAGSNNFTVSASGSKVTMTNDKANNGKFSNDEDSLIYYASKVDTKTDFELSATVNIDSYNNIEESSNPQQGSIGIAVLDSLYNKTDDKAYDDGIFLGTYGEKKTSDLAFYPIFRANSTTKTIGEPLSEAFSNTGDNLGSYKLSIKKSGNAYTLTCGDKTTTMEMNALEDDIFPCLYIARNAKATFSDVKLAVDSRKATSLELKGSCKTDYLYGEALDLTGLSAVVTYDDGTSEEVTDFLPSGYSATKTGTQTVTLTKGDAKATMEVKVSNLNMTDLKVNFPPIKTSYSNGGGFSAQGIEVEAVYDNGTSKKLDPSDYSFSLNGKTIAEGDIVNGEGNETVKITKKAEKGVAGTSTGSFSIYVNKNAYSKLDIKAPQKTTYYLGDKLDTTGMVVTGTYINDNGKTVQEVIPADAYKLTGFDSETVGEKTLSVTSGGVTSTLKLNVQEKKPVSIKLAKYPRTTYAVGQAFDPTDMEIDLVYDNGETENYTDYTVNNKGYDCTAQGKTSVTVETADYGSLTIPITIVENMNDYWRKSVFGQSSGYDKQESGAVGVTAENYGTAKGKINVKAWDGAGKITNDHDGMTYYYTSIKGNDDFKLTADVTVNKYLEHDNDDTKRNGQEAFGIMARDVVPLKGTDGNLTIDQSKAEKDDNHVAEPIDNSSVFASNMAILGGYSGTGYPTDETAANYDALTKINRINLLVRNGVTAIDGGGKRVGPYAVSESFPKEGNKYRLTMERMNGGIYARCYDYQTEKTMTKYFYDDSFLTTQNKDNAYVGFFASRWADIDVENVEFYETSKETDQTIVSNEKAVETPAMFFRDKTYSTATDYGFDLDVDNSKGKVTVKMNNEVIAQDEAISDVSHFKATLKPNSVNKLVAVYTPDDTLNLSSYEPIIIRENIYCKSVDSNVTTIYASPEGSFEGNGTQEKPFDAATAIGLCQAGQTVQLAGGTYKLTTPIEVVLGDNGTSDKPKVVRADEKARAIFDGDNATAAFVVAGDYWKFENIDVTNCAENQKAFHLGGSHNVVSNCKFYGNRDMGLQISRVSGLQDKSKWPAYNLVENCEAYNNCDPSMINADGFGAKLTVGEGNVFRNCKSHHNVDDGWDCYTKVNSGAIGAVTLENCEAYKMGFRLNADGTETPYGAGGHNGFKMGGENVGVQHVLINCKAYDNDHNGITTNSNPMLKLVNVEAYNNATSNIRLYSDKPEEYNYDVQGVISYNGGEADVVGTLTQDKDYKNASDTPLESEKNYWELVAGKSENSKGESVTQAMLK